MNEERKRVLIAEDSSVIQNLTSKILKHQDYEVISVKNGQQVLDKLSKMDFNVILLDITMPVMDGMECAKKIRAMDDKKKSQIPIIAITGNSKNYSLADFRAVGINEYMQKPLDFDVLVDLVKDYSEE